MPETSGDLLVANGILATIFRFVRLILQTFDRNPSAPVYF
jgi:hypothetical protein